MTLEKTNELLDKACKIITELEHFADAEQMLEIDALFDEIKYSDYLDQEMKL